MTTYKVQMMNYADYHRMMGGSYNYRVKTVYVEANTKEEAFQMVQNENPEMIVNTFVESVEEIEVKEKRIPRTQS